MQNEAWEKAVEAGARAMAAFCRGVEADWRFYIPDAERALRAAFPTMAEELVRALEAIDEDGGPDFVGCLRERIGRLIG